MDPEKYTDMHHCLDPDIQAGAEAAKESDLWSLGINSMDFKRVSWWGEIIPGCGLSVGLLFTL